MDIAHIKKTLFILSCCGALAACSSTGESISALEDAELNNRLSQLEQQQAELQEKEAALQSREHQLSSRESEIEQKLRAAETSSPTTPMIAGTGELFPPNAQKGHCYTRVFVEPKYRTVTEKVLKRASSERIEIVPAKYETVKEQVLVKEATTELKVVPATYKWVEERVTVKPATKRLVEVPASYEMVSENIMVKPASTEWKKGTGPIQRIDATTGEIMCLVEVPAVYKTVTKRVEKTPATTREIEEPATYETVKKRVVDQPATTREVIIPAQYKTVSMTKLVSPAQEKRIQIPEEYQTITRTEKVADGYMEWREILCETNMTRNKVASIQRALQSKGFNPGPVDGVIGRSTMKAVNAFQKANNLPVDKYLNVETVEALGVSPL